MSRENTLSPLNKEKNISSSESGINISPNVYSVFLFVCLFVCLFFSFNSFCAFLLLTCYKFDEGK